MNKKMIQQNKTEGAGIQDEHLKDNEPENVVLDNVMNQNQENNQQHDESKIQIVMPVRRTNDEQEDQSPIKLVESEDEDELVRTPQMILKQSERKQNANDVSAVCIDLYSENQTIQRKCTLNSLHYSRTFAQLKKQDKLFIQQGIQTSEQFVSEQLNEPILIQQNNQQLHQQQLCDHHEEVKSQQNQPIRTVEYAQKQTQQQIIHVLSNQKQEPKIIVTTQQHLQEEAKIPLKLTLFDAQNKALLQEDLSIKQTAFISLQVSFPQIRNRIITFQDIQNDESNLSRPAIQPVQYAEDQEAINLQGVNQNDYDNIILQLSQQIDSLQQQYSQLITKEAQNYRQNQEKQPEQGLLENHLESQIKSKSPNHKLSIQKTCELSISSPQKEKEIQKYINQNEPSFQQQPFSSSKKVQISYRRSQKIKQFSSGDVSNLLASSETQLIDLRDLQSPQQTPTNQQNLSQIPIVFSSSLSPQNSLQTNSFQLPILAFSQSNLATIKESYRELPYERFKNIMTLDLILSKISFKQKHFPSFRSNEKQLKLYGKRFLRLFFQQSTHSTNYGQKNDMLTLQNDLQYYKGQQHAIYYLKSHQNFAFICYFNHTIYIGEYSTQGPMKQIIRQGYGIQIRDSKYIYQGEFFADKKHGYGYIQFIGKNPFIYSGYFLDGFMDGYGKSINQNGQIYIGDYKLGQRDGIGRLIYNQDKNAYYEGEFYDGYKHGKGHEIFENGDSYKGFYLRDKFQGQGEYHWKNQTLYKGTFVDGYKHGSGLIIFANGKSFEKYYDHNKEINLEDDRKTIKSSRISSFSQNKMQEKTLIQEKPRNFRNTRSVSGQSLLSYKQKSNQKSVKLIKDKNKIAELLRQKEMQEDLRNLDKIMKDPADDKIKKIFSLKKIDTKDKIIGKMYNTTERPSMKISQKGQLDLFKLSKIGSQRKSLVNFDSEQKLEELRDSTHHRKVQRTTNFSQF